MIALLVLSHCPTAIIRWAAQSALPFRSYGQLHQPLRQRHPLRCQWQCGNFMDLWPRLCLLWCSTVLGRIHSSRGRSRYRISRLRQSPLQVCAPASSLGSMGMSVQCATGRDSAGSLIITGHGVSNVLTRCLACCPPKREHSRVLRD